MTTGPFYGVDVADDLEVLVELWIDDSGHYRTYVVVLSQLPEIRL